MNASIKNLLMVGSVIISVLILRSCVIGARAQELDFAPDLSGYDLKLPLPAVDLDKLSKAVACAETSCCRDGTAQGRNNCHGIMKFWLDENGNRQRAPRYFKTQEDSHTEFKRIWATHYKRFPDFALADRWTGGDNTSTWLSNVQSVYSSL